MFCVCTYKYTYTTEYTIDQIWINYLETMTGRWINQSNNSQWRFKWEEKQERRKNERLAKSNGWVFRRSEVCGSLYAAGPKGEFALFPPPPLFLLLLLFFFIDHFDTLYVQYSTHSLASYSG